MGVIYYNGGNAPDVRVWERLKAAVDALTSPAMPYYAAASTVSVLVHRDTMDWGVYTTSDDTQLCVCNDYVAKRIADALNKWKPDE